MKKMNLKFFGLRAKIVLPLFLLFGLFLFSANSASAQIYKTFEDAADIVKSELTTVINDGGHAYDIAATNGSNAIIVARYEYFKYLLSAFNTGDVSQAIEVTNQKMTEVYPLSPMKEAIVFAKQRALDLLTAN